MPTVPAFEQKKVVSLFVVLAWIGLALVVLWLLVSLRGLIPPLLVATIIAMTLTPEVDRMERRGLFGWKPPRWVAVGVLYFLFLCGLALLVRVIPLISGQLTDLITQHIPPELLGNAGQVPSHGKPPAGPGGAAAQDSSSQVTDYTKRWLVAHRIPLYIQHPVMEQARHVPELLGRGLQWLGANLPSWAGNLVWVVIVPIIAFFILLDFNKILGKTLLLVPRDKRQDILAVVTEVIAVFGNYVRGVLTVMALDIIVIAAVLWAAGLREYALTLAVTAGMLYTIPYFGAVVSTLLIGLVAWATHGTVTALWVTGAMILIHQVIFDNIIAPRVVGGSVSLHPLLALLALMAGGTLFGIGGTLLAVPLAAAVQVILVHLFPQLETDVVAVRRAAAVVRTAVDKKDEADKPPARKEGDQPRLDAEAARAQSEAQAQPPVPPVLPHAPDPGRN